MTHVPPVLLHGKNPMPALGFGIWQVPAPAAEVAVAEALRVGYRSIDTAKIYGNEAAVPRAIAQVGVDRKDVFMTTKLWNDAHGFDAALRAFDRSLAELGTEYVDLYLIHWPAPRKDLYVETYKALLRLHEEGRARSIGVSNFGPEHLRRLIDETGAVPAINQIELHPRFAQRELRQVHAELGIVTEAWSPLGQGALLDDDTVLAIANKHARTAAQVLLRWHLQIGNVVIPKSSTASRIRENFQVFDFTLDADDMARLDGMDDRDGRIGPNPYTASF